jgi:hypothetical protein
MTRRPGRAAVRLGVPTLLVASCAGAATVSLNASKPDIPSFAFGSHVVLAVQVALVLFYGALLLLVPLVRALDGDLPIELSLRGARWEEGVSEVSDELVARQRSAEERALREDLEIKAVLRSLEEELSESEESLEDILDQALERISALEEKVMSREARH